MRETLLSLAQLAVAIMRFSAIVEVLGRRGDGWQRDDRNAFNGMLVHALLAYVAGICVQLLQATVLFADLATLPSREH
jgi:hypothetical protein